MKSILLVALAVAAVAVVHAQGSFKPRDADEAHAWRLYALYKASMQKEAILKNSIRDLNASIATTATGVGALAANNAEDRAEREFCQGQLDAERSLQQKLIAAWDKKFYGRYGHLQDSAKTRLDEKTKRTMDEIEFQLTYFAFNTKPYPNVNGKWIIHGATTDDLHWTQVTATGGKFHATSSYSVGGTPYSWTMDGTIDRDGKVNVIMTHSYAGKIPYSFQLSKDGKTFTGNDIHWTRQ